MSVVPSRRLFVALLMTLIAGFLFKVSYFQ